MAAQILNKKESYDLVRAFLDMCSSRMKMGVQTKTCTQMFMQVLFTISKWQKEAKYPNK